MRRASLQGFVTAVMVRVAIQIGNVVQINRMMNAKEI